uniref:C-terminal-binding protein 2-like isoform X2 n=1 Tax=Oncorhynchus gorbuscha TaxID=8017 RepID=UPI001EAF7A7E|nr:C-terminal-binding protein 2-like isoform X2 [Oncorhynchus gorbuscha]
MDQQGVHPELNGTAYRYPPGMMGMAPGVIPGGLEGMVPGGVPIAHTLPSGTHPSQAPAQPASLQTLSRRDQREPYRAIEP